MPLVINGLGGGHTDRQTHTHTHAYRHVDQNFKKPGVRGLWPRAPGLKIHIISTPEPQIYVLVNSLLSITVILYTTMAKGS